jgi:hypothetical protein
MKKTIGRIFLLVLVAVLGYWLISGGLQHLSSVAQVQKEKLAKEEEERIKAERSIADMAKRNKAVAAWPEAFEYTIDVQDALIRTDNRPIVFLARIKDVVRASSNNYVCFEGVSDPPEIQFILDCRSDQIERIMQHRTDSMEHYAVVARISDLKRVKFQVTGYPEYYHVGDEYEGYVEAEVRLELDQPNIFVATGECIELLAVGYYTSLSSKELLGTVSEDTDTGGAIGNHENDP